MTARRRWRAAAALLAILGLAPAAPAQSELAATTVIAVSPPARVRLNGRSNLARWSCRGTSVEGKLEVAATRTEVLEAAASLAAGRQPAAAIPVPSFALRIPVASLRCGNRTMERDLRNAVDAEHYSEIRFRLGSVLAAGQPRAEGDGGVTVRVTGWIELAGVEREVTLDAVARRIAPERYRVAAEIPVRMTWFGITPPTGLFGWVRAEDAMEVGLDLTLALVPEPEPTVAPGESQATAPAKGGP